jgi:protein-disulfide isomerase
LKPYWIILPLLLASAAPAVMAPNWLEKVTTATNGAYVMGNPQAKVRLVEYVSYSCSHCAEFVAESKTALKRDYVARGLVAVEFRNAVRDQFDFAAALLARCDGPAKFFGHTEALLAAQPQWLGRAQGFLNANGARVATMNPVEGLKLTVRGVGMDKIMAKRGMTPARINVCLASKPAQAAVLGMTKEAFETRGITGTPTFLVNGTQLTNAGHWPVVEGSIKAALAVAQ